MVLSLLRNRTTVMWAVLISATLLSWWLGTGHGFSSAELASVAVLIVAFIKIRIVGLYFMELREAPTVLRGLFEGYCLLVCAVVIGMFLFA